MTLAARALHAGYPEQPEILRGVDLQLERGRFQCLLGPNGAGKSTLLRALAGMVPPAAGSVELEGRPLDGFSPAARARRIGFLPQEIRPAYPFRVDEAVALGARVAGHGAWFETRLGEDARAAVARALDLVEAGGLAERRLADLSGGERRRVLVAGVLAQEPDWLLLDEPAAMLDLHHQVALFELLRRLAGEGYGVLCVTHDLNLAASFADELVLLAQGRVHARGSAEEVLREEHLGAVFGDGFELVPRNGGAPAVLPRAGARAGAERA